MADKSEIRKIGYLSDFYENRSKVRFESVLPRSHGAILLCTVGVLLRKLEGGLRGVSHVVIDEIHERDLNTDFLLVVLRDIVHEFPDVRIVLMSATIDTSTFSNYFSNAPVIEVSGRTFPVNQVSFVPMRHLNHHLIGQEQFRMSIKLKTLLLVFSGRYCPNSQFSSFYRFP